MPLLVAFLFTLTASLAQEAKSCSSTYSRRNYKLQGSVIKSLPALNGAYCVEECSLNNCYSINYHHVNGICELNNANHVTNPKDLVYSAGYQYLIYNHSGNPPSICKDHGEIGVLFFPREGTEDKVLLENPFESLKAFTASVWAKPVIKSYQTLISYAIAASKDDGNEIYIDIWSSKMRIFIAETKVATIPTPYQDGKWHHYCVTWENTHGKWVGYIDGVNKGEGVHNIGHVITKGAFIIGQEQDSYKGGFVAFQSFKGNLTSVNMWDKALTAQEVLHLAKSCTSGTGNIIKWSDLANKGEGKAELLCNSANSVQCA